MVGLGGLEPPTSPLSVMRPGLGVSFFAIPDAVRLVAGNREFLVGDRICFETRPTKDRQPMTLSAGYAASRISSNLKGSTKQSGWLQALERILFAPYDQRRSGQTDSWRSCPPRNCAFTACGRPS